jgi:hypothetical protein
MGKKSPKNPPKIKFMDNYGGKIPQKYPRKIKFMDNYFVKKYPGNKIYG